MGYLYWVPSSRLQLSLVLVIMGIWRVNQWRRAFRCWLYVFLCLCLLSQTDKQIRRWPGLWSFEILTGAERFASKVVCLHGCWQETSALHLVALSKGLPECLCDGRWFNLKGNNNSQMFTSGMKLYYKWQISNRKWNRCLLTSVLQIDMKDTHRMSSSQRGGFEFQLMLV